MKQTFLIAALALMLVACGEPELDIVEDPLEESRGVALHSAPVRVRADEFVQVDVYLPADEEPVLARPVVFIQGGAVAAERYSWIGRRLARLGFASIHPHHPTDLALFSAGNAADVLAAVQKLASTDGHTLDGRIEGGRATVMGHSLGGVVASGAWVNHPEYFEHLVIMASFPAPSKDLSREGDLRDRVVSIVGGADPRVTLEDAVGGIEAIETPKTVAVVEGVSHYQFVDEPSADELENDGDPEVELDVAHDRIFFLVRTLLESPTELDDPAGWPAGVTAP